MEYVRTTVDTLGSKSMHGRGYVNKGSRLAADYISEEFRKLNLQKYGNSYEQGFDVVVNTFPGAMTLGINDVPLRPGVDFLVSPGCPSVLGEFKSTQLSVRDILDTDRLLSRLQGSVNAFIFIDIDASGKLTKDEKKVFDNNLNILKYALEIPVAGIGLLTSQKLTWSVSSVQEKRPILTIVKSAVPKKAKTIVMDLEAEIISPYPAQNIIGFIKGSELPDSLVVLSAHYDHLGRMGKKTYFPGANDNASGIAMLLAMAKHFSKPENHPKYTLVFMAFGGEELGLKGSAYFVGRPLFSLDKIKFLLNFDIAGTGDDGIQVVNGSIFKSEFNRLTKVNDDLNLLPQIKIRGEACNSDHCLFYKAGVPSFFIYTLGGIQAYHDVYDKPETLPLTKFESFFQLMEIWIEGL